MAMPAQLPSGLRASLPTVVCTPAPPALPAVAVGRKLLITTSSLFSFPFGSAAGLIPDLPLLGSATPWDTPYPPTPASPGCKGNPGYSSSNRTPIYREHRRNRHPPNAAAPCSLPAAPHDYT